MPPVATLSLGNTCNTGISIACSICSSTKQSIILTAKMKPSKFPPEDGYMPRRSILIPAEGMPLRLDQSAYFAGLRLKNKDAQILMLHDHISIPGKPTDIA